LGFIKSQLADEVYDEVSPELRSFLGTGTLGSNSRSTISKERKQQLYRFYRQLERWHKIVTVVGWVGIFLGHTIPTSKITTSSNAEFDQLLSEFSLQRPRIFALIDRHWPEAPSLIKMIGCSIFW
jgi:hypothetical protein